MYLCLCNTDVIAKKKWLGCQNKFHLFTNNQYPFINHTWCVTVYIVMVISALYDIFHMSLRFLRTNNFSLYLKEKAPK